MKHAMQGRAKADGANRRDPVRMGGILSELMRTLRPAVGKSAGKTAGKNIANPLADVSRIWAHAVGPEIARLTEVRRFRGGVMTVAVAATPLMAELQGFASRELIAALAEQGLKGIHELRFTAGAELEQRGSDPEASAGCATGAPARSDPPLSKTNSNPKSKKKGIRSEREQAP